MRVLSLFDGISCGRVALERVGIPVDVYYASEIDKYAIKIAQNNYPDTIQIGDVTKIDFTQFIGKVDLLMGGSPCQDLSIAGKREGLSGERSGLFYKFVEAKDIIKPKYFLLENNIGMPEEAYEEISRLMGCYPVEINSALVSAQQRKRYYWTNIKTKTDLALNIWTDIPQPKDKGIILQDVLQDEGNALEKKSYCLLASYNGSSFPHDWLRSQKSMIPVRIDKMKNASQGYRVYSVRGKSIALNANSGGMGAKTGLYKIDLPDGEYIVRKLTPVECERLQTLPDNYTEGVSNNQRYKMIGNGWTVDVIAHIFSFIEGV